jgi:hypothetical protein
MQLKPTLMAKMPEDFTERELLRFLQTYGYNVYKTVGIIESHFEWRIQNLPCKLTTDAINLIVSFHIRFINIRKLVFSMSMVEIDASDRPSFSILTCTNL